MPSHSAQPYAPSGFFFVFHWKKKTLPVRSRGCIHCRHPSVPSVDEKRNVTSRKLPFSVLVFLKSDHCRRRRRRQRRQEHQQQRRRRQQEPRCQQRRGRTTGTGSIRPVGEIALEKIREGSLFLEYRDESRPSDDNLFALVRLRSVRGRKRESERMGKKLTRICGL